MNGCLVLDSLLSLLCYHPIQTIDKCLIGYQPGKPIKLVLFSESVNFLDKHVMLFTTDKQINCQNFLTCEYRF